MQIPALPAICSACSLARQPLSGQKFLRISQVVCGEKKKNMPSDILHCTKIVWGKLTNDEASERSFCLDPVKGVTLPINHQNWWLANFFILTQAHHYV